MTKYQMDNTDSVIKLKRVIQNLLDIMNMQEGREKGELHTTQPTAVIKKYLWDTAIAEAKEVIK